MFSSNKWHKKQGSPSSFRRKRQLISLNSSVFIENLPSFERARARARANHAKIDAQKGCAMQLNGITLNIVQISKLQLYFTNFYCSGFVTRMVNEITARFSIFTTTLFSFPYGLRYHICLPCSVLSLFFQCSSSARIQITIFTLTNR